MHIVIDPPSRPRRTPTGPDFVSPLRALQVTFDSYSYLRSFLSRKQHSGGIEGGWNLPLQNAMYARDDRKLYDMCSRDANIYGGEVAT